MQGVIHDSEARLVEWTTSSRLVQLTKVQEARHWQFLGLWRTVEAHSSSAHTSDIHKVSLGRTDKSRPPSTCYPGHDIRNVEMYRSKLRSVLE